MGLITKYKNNIRKKSGITLVELIICTVLILVVMVAVANSFYVASESSLKSKSKFELLSQTKSVENILRGACSTAKNFSTSQMIGYNAMFEFTGNNNLVIKAKATSTSPEIIINLDKITSIQLTPASVGNKINLDYTILADDVNGNSYTLSGGIILNNVTSLSLNDINISYEQNKTFYIQ